MSPLAGRENFCVIIGSSASAMIGLRFVVITLIADMPMAQGQAQAGNAFGGRQTFRHFSAGHYSRRDDTTVIRHR